MATIENFPKLPAKKFAIALCSRNVWGVIMSDSKEAIQFSDGTSECWKGFACRSTVVAGWGEGAGKVFQKDVGDLWASRNPHVVAYIDGMENASLKEILAAARRKLSCMNL